jgi:hypothetical protein
MKGLLSGANGKVGRPGIDGKSAYAAEWYPQKRHATEI